MLTENVDRRWTHSLFLSEDLEYLNISPIATSVIFVFEHKCAAGVPRSSTNTSSSLLILLGILYDFIYLFR